MATFTALNIEYDNATEEDVDDTKEIQIEDALKLYQTALKYHADGPASFVQASEAYIELFQSEIFKYPESQSLLRRQELYGTDQDYEEVFEEVFATGPVQLPATGESAPNTLPQILHLAYKNHGQLVLDMLEAKLERARDVDPVACKAFAVQALSMFSNALDKDDTDLDLWGRTASVAALVGSERVSRYCLEAILDDEEEGVNGVLALPGVSEGFAIHKLREEVLQLRDDLALKLQPLARLQKKRIARELLRRLTPYSAVQLPPTLPPELPDAAERQYLLPTQRSWVAIGDAILRQYQAEQNGFAPRPGTAIGIKIPPGQATTTPETLEEPAPEDVEPEQIVESAVEAVSATNQAAQTQGKVPTQPEPSQDIEMIESLVPANGDQIKEREKTSEGAVAEESTGPNDEAEVPEDAQRDSRKRSSASAGLPEAEEEGTRTRSKRLKARESVAEKTDVGDAAAAERQLAAERLQPFTYADEALFETLSALYERLGISSLGSARAIEAVLKTDRSPSPINGDLDITTAIKDLHTIAETSAPEVVGTLLDPAATDLLGGNSREAGLNAFLGFTKNGAGADQAKPKLDAEAGLAQWLEHTNHEWLTVPELAMEWIEHMLRQDFSRDGGAPCSTYRQYSWTDELKRTIVQLIVHLDETLLRKCGQHIVDLEIAMLNAKTLGGAPSYSARDESMIEMIETLFELHLDVYSLISSPGAAVDTLTQMQAKDRLERWSGLADSAIQIREAFMQASEPDELNVRHLWATAFHLSVCDDVSQEHVIMCMHQLKDLLGTREGEVIRLQNNAVMPELSVAAIERELSRIHMKDFFLRIFADDENDPVNTIEMLEPILEMGLASRHTTASAFAVSDIGKDGHGDGAVGGESEEQPTTVDSPAFREMSKFLENSNVSLRLSLWQRLREAYDNIDYQPKVVSCYLKSIELLTTELKSMAFRTVSGEQRQYMLLRWLRIIDDALIKILAKTATITGTSVHLDCIDTAHLQSSLTALAELSTLLHTVDLLEDSVRVGLVPVPAFEGRAKQTFTIFGGKVHDIQLRLWMLSFALLKEGMSQDPTTFTAPTQDKFEFLRAVHDSAGVRGYCRASNKAFLRLLKEELLHLSDIEGRDLQLSQVLYDLYGLKCCSNAADLAEHGAAVTNVEALTKKTAAKAVDFVMAQAARVPPKDLPKLEMKTTIDKIHGALGKSKTNEATQANKRAVSAYLKAAVPPLELFRCLDGITSITAQPVSADEFPAASKGWYFLMGDLALNKYLATKSKTVASTPNEDLILAVAFFMQDLEFSFDRWETWYCLAQCYEMQLEEAVMYTAEKINTGAPELQAFQRSAIHCYTMAVATSINIQDSCEETLSKVAKMFSDFGTRIYASSREPFSMAVFKPLDAEPRFFSKPDDSQSPMRGYAFWPINEYTAWKFAAAMYRRAISRMPNRWWTHYMLGKCLWKMYTATDEVRNWGRAVGSENYRPSMQEVIDAFTAAVETLPQKKDNRRREAEPILEPHYKIVSIMNKLVVRKDIEASAASDMIREASDLCRKVDGCEDPENWEGYIVQLLKTLRAVDKANWHHRMTARAAYVLYGDGDELSAMGAKHEFTQQIFTKTMAVQVWKPENERPGRHFVYTTRYTRFFIKILCQLEDRANMEALSKRLRRKPQEFFEYNELWKDFCTSYLGLLRRWGKVPQGHEDAVFKSLNHEDFVGRAVRLEMWCQNPNTKSSLLDVLRDVIELKKVNNGLMKPTLIDDLIGDTYAKMYGEVGPSLDNEPLPPEVAAQLLKNGDPGKPGLTQAQLDGAGVNGAPAPAVAPETTSRPRKLGVGRRELQRRAEAAVTPPVRATLTIQPARSNSNVTVQVVVPSSSSAANGLAPPASGAATAASSAPGSVHDDADNESELSELEEGDEPEEEEEEAEDVIAVKPLFPNLRKESPVKSNPPYAEEMLQAQADKNVQQETAEERTAGGPNDGGNRPMKLNP